MALRTTISSRLKQITDVEQIRPRMLAQNQEINKAAPRMAKARPARKGKAYPRRRGEVLEVIGLTTRNCANRRHFQDFNVINAKHQ